MTLQNLLLLCIVLCVVGTPTAAFGQIIVGHRGASYDAPENTLAAFRLAWEQNADGVEGDFYVTADKQIVCIHDDNTKRTAGSKRVVAESTLDELRSLEYGNWKNPKYKGEPIPTFAEVMACVPEGKKFVIELKTGPTVVPLLRDELDRLKPDRSRLLIISFNKDTIAQSKRMIPDVKTHWLTSYKHNHLTGGFRPTIDQIAKTLREVKADGLGSKADRKVLTSESIQRLNALGMKEFHVWTVDDPDDALYYQKLGAIGITTNRPGLLRSILER
ncbi:MAG: glycerophosphodiester phosphodiesterase [Pirellulaceae bacterium]